MKLEGEQILIRIFVDVEKKYDLLFPLYKHLVSLAMKSNIAGLTVVKSLMGFIKNKKVEDLNILEFVDKPERINDYLDRCSSLLSNLLYTVERAHVFIYRTGSEEKGAVRKTSIINTVSDSRKKEVSMGKTKEKVLIRIFVDDSDRDKKSNIHLYELIFNEAKTEGFIGGVVYKGIMGFGKAGRVKALETVELSGDLPVVIEVIGDEDKIDNFLKFCDEHVENGLVTMEKIMVYVDSI
ncbi:MAG: DUF190 domain-containing protein [Proteobacteria bacterium]|nr:DUF190 domain-containing protein [Pseudomonadota bacterium]